MFGYGPSEGVFPAILSFARLFFLLRCFAQLCWCEDEAWLGCPAQPCFPLRRDSQWLRRVWLSQGRGSESSFLGTHHATVPSKFQLWPVTRASQCLCQLKSSPSAACFLLSQQPPQSRRVPLEKLKNRSASSSSHLCCQPLAGGLAVQGRIQTLGFDGARQQTQAPLCFSSVEIRGGRLRLWAAEDRGCCRCDAASPGRWGWGAAEVSE